MAPNNRMRRFSLNSSQSKSPLVFARSGMSAPSANKPPWMPDVARIHAVLHKRLTTLPQPRRSLWSKAWQFVWGD